MLRNTLRRLGGHSHGHAAAGAVGAASFDADAIASHASKPLERSGFNYKGSTKGGEVGARNEAAFVDYQVHRPENMNEKYGMPHNINLLTVMPLLMAIAVVGAKAWGIVLWDLYVARHYKPVIIERPANL